ncbi:MAG: hypothetical protein V1838_04385 [Patescibacteria group bacterium]
MMEKKILIDPWTRVPESEVMAYQLLADAIVPYIRQKPFDLWQFSYVAYYRVAVLRDLTKRGPYPAAIRFVFHSYYTVPSERRLRKIRSHWSDSSIRRQLIGFAKHEEWWGPGDLEKAVIDVRKDVNLCRSEKDLLSLDPKYFQITRVNYRTDATAKNFVKQVALLRWDKAGGVEVAYEFPMGEEVSYEMIEGHIVVTMRSYHHDGKRREAVHDEIYTWKIVDRPRAVYFDDATWVEKCMHRKDLFLGFSVRDQESWEGEIV